MKVAQNDLLILEFLKSDEILKTENFLKLSMDNQPTRQTDGYLNDQKSQISNLRTIFRIHDDSGFYRIIVTNKTSSIIITNSTLSIQVLTISGECPLFQSSRCG